MHHCPEFASRVKQVELELPAYQKFVQHPDRTFAKFWNKVQERFPSAQAFVLIYDYSRSKPPPSTKDFAEYLAIYELVVSTPPGITTRVALRLDDCDLGYRLYQVQSSSWTIVEDLWVPMRVILPARRVPHDFLLHNFLVDDRSLYCRTRQGNGREWLTQQTYALHSPGDNGKSFKCPQPDCDYMVAEWREFKSHHRSEHDYTERETYVEFPYHPDTAAEMKATIDAKERCIEDEFSDIAILSDKLTDPETRAEAMDRRFKEGLQFDEALEGGLIEYGFGFPLP